MIATPEQRFETLMRALERELTDIGLELEALAVDYIDKKKINVTGDLRKSITSEVRRELNSIHLQFGTNQEYAVFVHEGTRPHMPPEKPIRQWVVKKLGVPAQEVDRVTAAVRWKIFKKGTEGKPFLAVPFRAYRRIMAQRIADTITKNLTN